MRFRLLTMLCMGVGLLLVPTGCKRSPESPGRPAEGEEAGMDVGEGPEASGPTAADTEGSGPVKREYREKMIFDFSEPRAVEFWSSVNDTVMGGRSESRMEGRSDGTALFVGNVSLENRGGFASVRCDPAVYDLGDYDAIQVRVKGDGKRYRFSVRTDDKMDGVYYQVTFDTQRDTWRNVRFGFEELVPTFRGERVADAPALDPSEIRSFGFMIADGQEGPFRLDVEWMKALSAPL
jgi:hypothetical protein